MTSLGSTCGSPRNTPTQSPPTKLDWKIQSGSFLQVHHRLFGWMLRVVVRSAKLTFKLRILLDDPRPPTVADADRRPALVLSRHAGPGDSMLLMDVLFNRYRRQPRIVLKELLQWDPAVDVLLNRLPAAFVPGGRKSSAPLIQAIKELAGSMDSNEAFVIFPEGANYTEGRRARAIQKLREIGRPDLAERAQGLQLTYRRGSQVFRQHWPQPRPILTCSSSAMPVSRHSSRQATSGGGYPWTRSLQPGSGTWPPKTSLHPSSRRNGYTTLGRRSMNG